MDLKVNILILTIAISAAHSACICSREEVPMWEAPCGMKIKDEDFDLNEPAIEPQEKRAMIRKSLKVITQTLNLSIYFYQRHNHTKKNDDIVRRFSSSIFQDVDGWLPTSQKVQSYKIRRMKEVPKVQMAMYNTLQKYAMMFNLMLTDDHDKEKQDFAKRTMEYLKSLLCELQSALIALQEKPIGSPERIPDRYSYDKETQKTETHLRDAEIISKYGKLLLEWRGWIRTVRKQFQRKRQRKNSKSSKASENNIKQKIQKSRQSRR